MSYSTLAMAKENMGVLLLLMQRLMHCRTVKITEVCLHEGKVKIVNYTTPLQTTSVYYSVSNLTRKLRDAANKNYLSMYSARSDKDTGWSRVKSDASRGEMPPKVQKVFMDVLLEVSDYRRRQPRK